MRLTAISLFVAGAAFGQLSDIAAAWKADPDLAGATFAYCVMNAKTGKILAEEQSTVNVIPASTLKIFTTGAALGKLGTSFRYSTRIGYTGTLDGAGNLTGDIVIIGSGDPSLQSEHFTVDRITRSWARLLHRHGIRSVSGNVVAYAGAWQYRIPDQWIWCDISNYYGAAPCALNFRDNKFKVQLSSGAGGSVAKVLSIQPQYISSPVTLTTAITCEGTEDKAYVYGDPRVYAKEVRGTIPQDKGRFTIEGALPDPALLCAEELSETLRELSVSIKGKPVSVYNGPSPRIKVVHIQHSPHLSSIVEQTNLQSNNLYCESLLLTMGKGDRDSGLAEVRRYWTSKGLRADLLFLTDGSGLSRANTCTARLQCEALQTIYSDSVICQAFDNSLPRAGKTGSMRSIGKGTALENNLRAKTGYIERVRAYCGYLKNREGEDLVFSVIMNHYRCSPGEARMKIEKFMLALPELSAHQR